MICLRFLADDTIDVVDITPYPEVRGPMIEAALQAGKHVLSQKPFVLDLDEGARLADLADAQGVKLAVNQNGRWSPHMAWMRAAVQAGLVGEVLSCHTSAHWDHTWVAGTEFDRIEDLVLYDFGIHWFDFVASIMPGARAKRLCDGDAHGRSVGEAGAAGTGTDCDDWRTGQLGVRWGNSARAARHDQYCRHPGQSSQ